jgi:transmembrane sensor
MSRSIRNWNREREYLHAKEASTWIEALRDPSTEHRTAFVGWLKESPRNVRDILDMLTVDQALGHLDARRVHDIQSLVSQADVQTIQFPKRPNRAFDGAPSRRVWRWAGLAACVSAALVAASISLFHTDSGWTEYRTATSEQRAFGLEDGSVVHLNTHSRVAVRFSAHARDLRLIEGEALFRVRHDPARPFRVYTSDAVVQEIGTQFDVYNRVDGTVVAVLEGQVSVTPSLPFTSSNTAELLVTGQAGPPVPSESRIVHANEEAQVSPSGVLTVKAVLDTNDVGAWRERRLIFRQQSLAHIVGEFNRYNKEHFVLEGQAIENRLYTGVFDADDPDSLVQVLRLDADLSLDRYGDKIVVKAR